MGKLANLRVGRAVSRERVSHQMLFELVKNRSGLNRSIQKRDRKVTWKDDCSGMAGRTSYIFPAISVSRTELAVTLYYES